MNYNQNLNILKNLTYEGCQDKKEQKEYINAHFSRISKTFDVLASFIYNISIS